MNPADAAAMEASLVVLGDRYEGLPEEVFAAFIQAHPQYAHAFINPAAARERMTRETLEALLGLAAGESWVAVAVTNFVDLHRNYADFTPGDYARWFAMVIETMARRAGEDWTAPADAAWRRQAKALAEIIATELGQDWAHKKSLA